MDKVMAVIISATTVLAAGLMALAIGIPSITNLDTGLDSAKSGACDTQISRYESGDVEFEDIDEECIESSDELTYRYLGEKHRDTLVGS